MDLKDKLAKAEEFLSKGEYEQAIDVLRCEESPKDGEACRLLARAYFNRGDTRGDVYSSMFFAERAKELGIDNAEVRSIIAIGAFRKERYEQAAEAFGSFVTADSPASAQFLYGASLMYIGKKDEGQTWLNRAAFKDARCQNLLHDLTRLGEFQGIHPPPTGNMYESVIDKLRDTSREQIPSPYEHQPISVFRGKGYAPKDFDWSAKNVPCQHNCPAGTNIPEYLRAIYEGDYDRSYRINLWDNVFPGVLGRVCSRPCEEACRHGWQGLGQSVAICWSKRSGSDHKKEPFVALEPLFPKTGKKVAVVGGGVAGLAAARQLALVGHDVIVYEKHVRAGGMMNQGIPEFRLPRAIIEHEISQIEASGVTIECGVEIGKDISLQELKDRFDAIVLAAGTLKPNLLELPGKELKGIHHGLEFLLGVNEKGERKIGKNVIVIGGGFTAMDCARTAWRLGAKSVRVLYRRSVNEMLITPGELEELKHEGIPMEFMVSPTEYISDGTGNVKAVRFIKNELGEKDKSGRRRPVPVKGSEFDVEADTVLLATGQFPDTAFAEKLLGDKLLADASMTTTDSKIFLAGDFAQGAASLIKAIGHAKTTARKVDEFLTGQDHFRDVVKVSDARGTGRIREMDYVPVQPMPALPVAERKLTAEVETGYSKQLAVDETQRCYLCHFKYEIDHDRCIYCDWCIKAKPRPKCILKVKELVKDEEGRTVRFDIAQNSEETKYIYINQEDCIRCHACVNACPVDCISVQKVSRCVETCDGRQLE